MSRLENKKKAGYFPTPYRVVERIAGHLTPPRGAILIAPRPTFKPEGPGEGSP
jgi:hypothetical protein